MAGSVRLERRLSAGRSHRMYQGRSEAGDLVAVKVGGDARSLAYESDILHHLAAADYPAPYPLGLTFVDDVGRSRQPALVLSWLDGTMPRDRAGWHSIGVRLAQLHSLPAPPGLPQRLLPSAQDLPDRLRDETGLLPWIRDALEGSGGDPVFSHGDAAPENFLHEAGAVGAFVDFESACRQPAGADLGRVLFFLVDGSPARTIRAARALLRGYGRRPVDLFTTFAWAAAEGLRIATWRHRNAGRPGVPSWALALATADRCRQTADALRCRPC